MNWQLINARCQDVLPGDYAGAADLILTSPPYDDLRQYGGHNEDFDFAAIAPPLVQTLADGGVLCWVVADAIIDGSETGSSMRQALAFMDLGLRLHQTLIYERAHPKHISDDRCMATTQYMFILSKGRPKTATIIADRRNVSVGPRDAWQSGRAGDSKATRYAERKVVRPLGKRSDIWRYGVGFNLMGRRGECQEDIHRHPAVFPYPLAADHIATWTAPGDLVVDPMCGSGTTLRAAADLGRRVVGIEANAEYCGIVRRRMAQAVLC